MDSDLIARDLEATLKDPDLLAQLEEVRSDGLADYQDVWFCYQIAPSSDGVHQWREAAMFLGLPNYIGDEQPEWIWEDIERKANVLVTFLNYKLRDKLPPGCSFHVGHWENGGCYGIVLGYNYEDDDRNFHTVCFTLNNWQKLQRLKFVVEDARESRNYCKTDMDMYRANRILGTELRRFFDEMEAYIV